MENLKSKILRTLLACLKFIIFTASLMMGIFLIWFFNEFQPNDILSCDNYFETTAFVDLMEDELRIISKAALDIKKNENKEFDMSKSVLKVTEYGSDKVEEYKYKDIEKLCKAKKLKLEDLEKWKDSITITSDEYVSISKERYTELFKSISIKNYDEKTNKCISKDYSKNAYIYILDENVNGENTDIKLSEKEYVVYSDSDDVFYSTQKGWYKLPQTLYFEKNGLNFKEGEGYSTNDLVKNEYYSISQVVMVCALDYMSVKEAREILENENSISFYIVEKDDGFEKGNVQSIKEINEKPFNVTFNLKDTTFKASCQSEKTAKQYKTITRFFQTYWGKNAKLYFGLKDDYSDLTNLHEKSLIFERYRAYLKNAMIFSIVGGIVWLAMVVYFVITTGDKKRCSKTIMSIFDFIYSDILTILVVAMPIAYLAFGMYLYNRYKSLFLATPMLMLGGGYVVTYTLTSLNFYSVVRRFKEEHYLKDTIFVRTFEKIRDFIKSIKKTGAKVVIYMFCVLIYIILNTGIIYLMVDYKYQNKYENAVPVNVLNEKGEEKAIYQIEQKKQENKEKWYIEYRKGLFGCWIILNMVVIYYVGRKRIELVTIYNTAKTMADNGNSTELIDSNDMLLNEKKLANSINQLYKGFKDKRENDEDKTESIDKAKSGIDEVIDLLKGNKKAKRQVIHIKEMFKEIFADYKNVVEEKEVDLKEKYSQEKLVIVSDKDLISKLIRSILECICQNMKATGRMTVSIFAEEKKVCLQIKVNIENIEEKKMLELSIAKIYVVALKGIMTVTNSKGICTVTVKFNEIRRKSLK